MNIKYRFSLLLIVITFFANAIFISGCQTSRELYASVGVTKNLIKAAKERQAKTCAPKELALAEAHFDFLQLEIDQGNFIRAKEHRYIAMKQAQNAVDKSKGCTLLNEPPPVLVEANTESDKDRDGIIDSKDECVELPEDKDGFLDEDGCPDNDNDEDGLADIDDGCPNQPGLLENLGCPVNDSDKDGIIDSEDDCPSDPGLKENHGCPVTDQDKDGISDDKDNCPTVFGVKENQGCPQKVYTLVSVNKEAKKIEIKDKIYFETGKAIIKPQSHELLNQIADVLKNYATMEVSIEGHTDSDGSASANLTLSENRANAVRDYIVSQGIKSIRLAAVGFGESAPIQSNKTARGKEANRRVEFRITKYK